jgi:hypothetical protein
MGSHIFVKIPMYFAAVSQIEGNWISGFSF